MEEIMHWFETKNLLNVIWKFYLHNLPSKLHVVVLKGL